MPTPLVPPPAPAPAGWADADTVPSGLGRRSALATAAVAGAGSAVAVAQPASARKRKGGGRRRWTQGVVLRGADRHVADRFGYGHTPRLARQVRKAGSGQRWFERQLRASSIPDRRTNAMVGWFPSLRRTPTDLWNRQRDGVEGGWEVMADYQRWLLLRRIHTERPVAERMAEFWMNLLHVPVTHDAVFPWRFDYDRTIREHALGRFDDLLHAAITHPAMGLYLDNAVSTKDAPNENLGRELLELHTVGRGHYTEADVKASARILTGWHVDVWKSFKASYEPSDHWTGRVSVMGFSHANGAADGRAVTRAYLTYLAHHPATAERVVRRLAEKFVKDTPSAGLVRTLKRVYLRHDTAIVPVLRALVAHKEFKNARAKKVRDPSEELVATYRALRVRLARPTDDGNAVKAMLWTCQGLGSAPCDWPRPDGAPTDAASWSSPARLLASFDYHWSMAGGWWPSKGIAYRSPKAWLPRKRMRFDLLVDYLSVELLGTHASSTLVKACLAACPPSLKVRSSTVVTPSHGLVRWGFYRVLGTILDSPDHFVR